MWFNFLSKLSPRSSQTKFRERIYKLMLKNRRVTDGYQFTVPSPDTYPYQWFWDSCFHSIILSYFNIEDSKKEILSLLSRQFKNGLIPHMIYWDAKVKSTFPKIKWGLDGTSSITQPPMVAYAVWEIYQKDKGKEFLAGVYPGLYHYYRYLLSERDPRENHLVGILSPDESGEDNSPRFDIPQGLPAKHTIYESNAKRFQLAEQNIKCDFDAPFCMKNFFWVKDVPFNAITIRNLEIMAGIAEVLEFKEDVEFFRKKKKQMVGAMKKLMFEDGLCWSTYGEDYKKIKVKTWAIFAPLFAGILSPEEASDLVKKEFYGQDFKTRFMMPTVSTDEPAFDPDGFWRGPVWIGTNWFVYKGLVDYGFFEEAEMLKRASMELLEKSGFREYFNPLTGKGLGARNFTWCGLVLDMGL